jgi:hypothetical protein
MSPLVLSHNLTPESTLSLELGVEPLKHSGLREVKATIPYTGRSVLARAVHGTSLYIVSSEQVQSLTWEEVPPQPEVLLPARPCIGGEGGRGKDSTHLTLHPWVSQPLQQVQVSTYVLALARAPKGLQLGSLETWEELVQRSRWQ